MSLTSRQHAIIAKKIINHDAGGRPIVCCWDDCTADATTLHTTRTHEHLRSVSCEAVDAGVAAGRHVTFAFCSGRHKGYWDNATGGNALDSIARTGRAYGNLPVGSRGSIL